VSPPDATPYPFEDVTRNSDLPSSDLPPSYQPRDDPTRADEAPAVEVTGANGRRTRRRAVRPGVGGEPVIPSRSADDSDVGWHEGAGEATNDERLRRDVPPHW